MRGGGKTAPEGAGLAAEAPPRARPLHWAGLLAVLLPRLCAAHCARQRTNRTRLVTTQSGKRNAPSGEGTKRGDLSQGGVR